MSSPAPLPERAAAEPDLCGRTLGKYHVLRRLGRGAMAEVYLAEQTSLKRNIALKVLKRHLANDATYVKRFHMEAQAAAALVHANIVQIYEVDRVDGVHYIAQEYVSGKNLAEQLQKHGPLEAPIAVAIMCQVCSALHKAAEQGVVHRDIKPENIMLAKSGEVKVADFGLARVVDHADALQLTQAGVTMGTPLYMSPEQVEGKPLDPRSDIYSFGVACYQMLAGRTPFRGESALSVAVQHLQSTPERLENLRPDLPAGLCRIVHRMMEKSPDERYQDARLILRELRELPLAGLEEAWPQDLEPWSTTEIVAHSQARAAATQQLTAVMHAPEIDDRPLIRRRWFWLALAGAFLLGGLLAYSARPRPLLAEADAETPGVEQMENAQQQYLFALASPSEETLRSVIDYFPHDELHARLAERELARLYLDDARFREALSLFDRFANFGASEPEYRAFGLAGQYIVYSLQGNQQQAATKLSELWPLRDRLDERMGRMVRTIIQKSSPGRNGQRPTEIDAWLENFEAP